MADRDRATFAYVLYVKASPEEVWEALTEPELTRRYWIHENVSDWKPGSRWEHRRTDEEGTVDIVGEVVESEWPERLVVTWVPPQHEGDPEKTSRVTVELVTGEELETWPGGPWVQVRLTHSELEPGSEMHESVSWGWPAVLSGMKTLVEWPGPEPPF